MTERDAFEVRLHAAIRGYVGRVSSDLNPVELAHRIATGAPRRRGLAASLTWPGVAIPRVAWVLLIAAGLLAATMVGMLVVGWQPAPKLPAVVPPVGPVAACPPGSNPDEPGPAAQARPPHDSPMAMAFDRRAGRLVALADAGIGPETWAFDVCTNTWTQMHPNREPSGIDERDLFVYDVDSDVTIAVDRDAASVWAYDLRANSWARKGDGPTDVRFGAYDPRSGLVVAPGNSDNSVYSMELWNYDVETDTWTPIPHAPGPPAGVFAYDASVDRMVVYTAVARNWPTETWLLDIRTGTWRRSSVEMPALAGWATAPRIVYDETAKRTVVSNGSRLAAFDATADHWEIVAQDPVWASSVMVYDSPIAYDSVNQRLVGLRGDDVLAFDTQTRERTVLLEASQGQPAATAPSVGPAFECPPGSTPDEPGPVDQARPPQNSNASVAFDRRAGRLVAFTSAETWTFDVCTNTWTKQHPDQQPLGVDDWSLFVYDVDSDLTIAVDRYDGTVWAYDLQADAWTRKGNGPVAARHGAYDPLTGLVVAATDADPVELWTYDVEADTWTPVHLGNEAPVPVPGGALAYDASVDRFVWYGDGAGGSPPYETWLFDIRTGTWWRSAAERPAVVAWLTAPRMAYDESAGKTVVLLRYPQTAYDATADRWEVLAEPEAIWPYPGRMVYDPVNHRLVGLGQTLGTPDIDVPPGGVEALDLVKGERRVLLERVGGQAVP